LTANGIHSVRDPQFLDSFRKRECAKTAKRDKAASEKRSKKKRNVGGVTAMREKHGHERTHHFLQCTLEECGAYLQYKKQDKDPGMPKSLVDRRLHCREWMSRPSPHTPITEQR